jgi:hypothetical protein
VLLDRDPSQGWRSQPSRRPVDWWRSPDWLTPYGAAAVLEAELAPSPPGPAGSYRPAELVAFLLNPAQYRLGVLAALLDACAAALAGGPPVALATADTDRAAWWVAAVSHLMAPATAQRLGFSTLERPGSLATRHGHGVLLCCVPAADYDQLREQRGEELVLLSEDEDVDLGDLDGEPHRTAAGDRVAVTEWSVMAKVALIDEASGRDALTAVDALAGRLALEEEADGLSGEPAWPLALVVAQAPDAYADASAEAARVLLRRGVAGLRRDRELRHAVQLLVDGVAGGTAQDVWARLRPLAQAQSAASDAAEPLLERYVTCAASDQEWLTQDGGAPVPAPAVLADWRPTPECTVLVEQAVSQLGARSGEDEEAAVALVRLTDFLSRLGLLSPAVVETATVALERGVVPGLVGEPRSAGDPAVRLVRRLAGVGEPVLALVRPLVNGKLNELRLAGASQVLGRFLAEEVLDWLYPVPPPPVWLDEVASLDDLRLRAEIARVLALRDPHTHAGERPLAVLMALRELRPEAEVRQLLRGPRWLLDELLDIESRCLGALPLAAFAPVFKSEAESPRLDRVANELAANRWVQRQALDPVAEAVLRLRQLGSRQWWRSRSSFSTNLADVLEGGLQCRAYPEAALHPDVVDHLQAAMLIAVADGRHLDRVVELVTVPELGRATARSGTYRTFSEGCHEAVPVDRVALLGLLGHPGFPEPVATPVQTWAAKLTTTNTGRTMPAVQRYLSVELAEGRISVEQLQVALDQRLADLLAGTAAPERTLRAASRFASSWLRSLAPRDGLLNRFRSSS